MYIAAVSMIVGQGLILADAAVLLYGAGVAVVLHAWLVFYEEAALRRRFGAEYRLYCREARRWRPRLTPWVPGVRPEGDEGRRPGRTSGLPLA